jgi:Spy/CpxP family protein refolding chaperone
MKKILIGAAVLALSATLAQAAPRENTQAQKKHHLRPDSTSRLVDQLTLTDEQKKEIAEIRDQTAEDNGAFLDEMEQTLNDLRTAREANDQSKVDSLNAKIAEQREQLQRIREDELQTIMNVLTREQHVQFEELRAAREAQKKKAGQ